MAELHVQTKKTGVPSWIWIVFLLIVVVVIAYVFMTRNNEVAPNTTTTQKDTITFIRPAQSIQSNECVYA
jgi:lipopolysaccharide export LptBFGC system permease protein LptF